MITQDLLDQTFKGKSDFEIYNFIVKAHKHFMKFCDDTRRQARLPKSTLDSIARDQAEKMGVLNYKGLWIEPLATVPEKIVELIDARVTDKDVEFKTSDIIIAKTTDASKLRTQK